VCHVSLPSSYRSRRGHIHLLRVLPLVGCRSKTPTEPPPYPPAAGGREKEPPPDVLDVGESSSPSGWRRSGRGSSRRPILGRAGPSRRSAAPPPTSGRHIAAICHWREGPHRYRPLSSAMPVQRTHPRSSSTPVAPPPSLSRFKKKGCASHTRRSTTVACHARAGGV
jgi:hypothetical protein